MPRPKHGPPLKKHEAKLVRRWIQEGAEWNNHWSFEKPTCHEVPKVSNTSQGKNTIGSFVLANQRRTTWLVIRQFNPESARTAKQGPLFPFPSAKTRSSLPRKLTPRNQ